MTDTCKHNWPVNEKTHRCVWCGLPADPSTEPRLTTTVEAPEPKNKESNVNYAGATSSVKSKNKEISYPIGVKNRPTDMGLQWNW